MRLYLFWGDETGKTIRVTFKPKKIYGAIKEGGANVEYVLPVHLVSASDSVNADKNKVLLRCNVSPVVVSFGESREQLILNSAETYHVVPVSIVKKGALATDIQLDLISQADLDENMVFLKEYHIKFWNLICMNCRIVLFQWGNLPQVLLLI